jgi:hypothetical protein
MFNIFIHQGNINQNYTAVQSNPRVDTIKKTNNKCCEDAWGKLHVMSCWWEYKLV